MPLPSVIIAKTNCNTSKFFYTLAKQFGYNLGRNLPNCNLRVIIFARLTLSITVRLFYHNTLIVAFHGTRPKTKHCCKHVLYFGYLFHF